MIPAVAPFDERYKMFYNEHKKKCNPMRIPVIKSVSLSAGCGKFHKDSKKIDYICEELTNIAGQKAVLSRIQESISNFNVREGAVVGVFVTLRGASMKEFIDRLVFIDLPRMHKLTGLPLRSFDSRYNYNMGIEKQEIFLASKALDLFGLNISIKIARAYSEDMAASLLEAIGLPLNKRGGGVHASK